jgi:hypothetical protein
MPQHGEPDEAAAMANTTMAAINDLAFALPAYFTLIIS